MAPLATVVVLTRDHAALVDLAVASALDQTVSDIEVMIVGDGVADETRTVVRALVAGDERVRFLDLEKTLRGETAHLERAVHEARGAIVCCLCDEDLLLSDHVATMLELLHDADVTRSLNGHLNTDGTFTAYRCELASSLDRSTLASPLERGLFLTGCAHTVSAYHRLPLSWAPPTVSHDQARDEAGPTWYRLVAPSGVRRRISTRLTALRFPPGLEERASWDPEDRRAELVAWRRAMATLGWRRTPLTTSATKLALGGLPLAVPALGASDLSSSRGEKGAVAAHLACYRSSRRG